MSESSGLSHPSDDMLRQYAARELPVSELLRVDDHLASCEECRDRLPQLVGGGSLALGEDPHLSYEELEAWVAGSQTTFDAELTAQHLVDCPRCAAEEGDLRRFAAGVKAEVVKAKDRRTRWGSTGRWVAMGIAASLGLVYFATKPAARVETAVVHPVKPLLVDRGRAISRGADGMLVGIPTTDAETLALVTRLVVSGELAVALPASLPRSTKGVLLGGDSGARKGSVLSPIGAVVESDRPKFAWTAPAGSVSVVEVYDADFNAIVASGNLAGTEWISTKALPRGKNLQWVVRVTRNGKMTRVPSAPAPEAHFQVVASEGAEAMRQARESGSDLLIAASAAKWGLAAEAAEAKARLAKEHPSLFLR